MIKDELEQFVIPDTASIGDAMLAIEKNCREVVLVSDGSEVIVGVITDGDIRRGLLGGLVMATPAAQVMTTNFISVPPKTDRTAVLDLMQALRSTIYKTLKTEYKIKLDGLGVFQLKDRKARQARNPRTGELVNVPAKKVVKFRVLKDLKEAVLS